MTIATRLATILLLLVVIACAAPVQPQATSVDSPSSAGSPSQPKRLTIAIKSVPAYISDKVFAGAGGYPGVDLVEDLLNSGLTLLDHQGIRRPQLAESVPTIENGQWRVAADGRMETTSRLRDGILWHDGTPLTAQDLVFTATIEQDRDLAIPPSVASSYQGVDAVEAPDPRTVVVKWKRPYIFADDMFNFPVPRHLVEQAYREDKSRLPELSYWRDAFVGTGPFRLQRFVIDSHLVLEANDRYIQGRPKIDEITVRFISDSNTLGANILAGEVEMSMGRGLSFSEGLQIRDQWRGGKMEIAVEAWYAMFVQWIDPTPTLLADVRFRRALLHGLDRQQMADVLQGGLVPVAHSFVGSWEPEYKDVESSIIRYDYDPRRATQMIEELGYSKGADGFFRDRAGQPLALEVRAANEPEIDVNSNLTVRDAWRALGVAAESELYSRQLSRDLEYRATFPAFQLQRQPNRLDTLIRFQSAQVPLAENNWRGENKGRYTNPEMDALVDRFYTTIPRQERNQLLAQITRHMTERLNVLGLFNDGIPVMVGNHLRNIYAVNQTWNATEWDRAG